MVLFITVYEDLMVAITIGVIFALLSSIKDLKNIFKEKNVFAFVDFSDSNYALPNDPLPVAIILPLELILPLAVICDSTNKLPPICNDADGFCIPCIPTLPEADICNPGLLVLV